MILHLIAIWLLTPPIPIHGQGNFQDMDWDKAASEIRRLPASAFPELPAVIRGDLDRRQCTIPQAYGYPRAHNVIRGSFTAKGQADWAVLCSQGGESTILVFKGGSIESVSQLAKGPDKNLLQVVGEGKIGYSRLISPVNGGSIVRYYREFGGPKPPPIDHEGIEDSFVGKASVILFYYSGAWLRLTGAD